MKQIVQDLAKGNTLVAEVARPGVRAGHLLIQTTRTLISAGTERMLVDFGRANYLEKARQQPDKVRQVIDKARTDGIATTIEAVRAKLDQPLPMGYSNVGHVIEVGAGVEGFAPGDRVVSNGHHAEFVVVPRNLCARVPDDVDDDDAAFTILGAIALQGIRLIAPTLGERVFVSGLGLIGLMTVQILRANGCAVLGADFDPAKLALARSFGAQTVDLSAGEDPVAIADRFSRGAGMDAVLITASTKSSEPVSQAAAMSRQRGRIVLVGVTGLELNRADFYKKELSFQVSCSYGPGRYDDAYEQKGHDYPAAFVRWTEQRNFEAVLGLLADGRIDVSGLVSAHYPLDSAPAAYERLTTDRSVLGVVLDYDAASPADKTPASARSIALTPPFPASGRPTLAAIGAGNYASRVLLPAFAAADARLKTIATQSGLSGTLVGTKLGFEASTTDADSIFADPEIDAIVVATRHDSHAGYVLRALEAGKSVFVEKPLALTLDEVQAIERAYAASRELPRPPLLMIGFNRRFAPLLAPIRRELARSAAPPAIVYTCNAGAIPPEHWTQDVPSGGGRIVGEACHFIDLARDLASAPIARVTAIGQPVVGDAGSRDTASIGLAFKNGAIATIHYFANGHRALPKERMEIFQAGRVLQLDNYCALRGFGVSSGFAKRFWSQDKGQTACAKAFVDTLRGGGPAPIPIDQIWEVARASIEAATLAGR